MELAENVPNPVEDIENIIQEEEQNASQWKTASDVKRRSRYGRHQKIKNTSDYIPSNVAKFVPKTPHKFKKPLLHNIIKHQLPEIKNSETELSETQETVQQSIELSEMISTNAELLPPNPTTEFKKPLMFSIAKKSPTPEEKTQKTAESPEKERTVEEYSKEYSMRMEPSVIIRRISDSDSACGSSVDDFDIDNSDLLRIGMLCWARVNSFKAFWPCIVCEDPEGRIVMEQNHKSNKPIIRIHIRYFGDNGRRSWIFRHNIIAFRGLNAFKNEYKIEVKQYRNPKLKNIEKVIYLSPRLKLHWDVAVAQAEGYLSYSLDGRITKFFDDLLAKSKEEKSRKFIKRKLLDRSRRDSLNSSNLSKNDEDLNNTIQETNEPPNKKRRINEARSNSIFLLTEFNNFKNNILAEIYNKRNTSKKDDMIKLIQELWAFKYHSDEIIKKVEVKQPLNLEELFLPDIGSTYLTKGLSREFVCRSCHKTKNLLKCNECYHYFHKECTTQSNMLEYNKATSPDTASNNEENNNVEKGDATIIEHTFFKCDDCVTKIIKCSVCNSSDNKPIKCSNLTCNYYYHLECIKHLPHSYSSDKLFCPVHICRTCAAEDSRAKLSKNVRQLSKCVLCPTSYHIDVNCIPAGTQMLTQTQIICPRHLGEKQMKKQTSNHFNVNWCFICTTGGSLICCDTCLAAFHLDCLKLPNPPAENESYMCDDCESGKLPIYNDIVWAKLGKFRLWPALVLPPPTIPQSLKNKKKTTDEFCVRFFGTHDMGWITKSKCFLYQEDDFMKDQNVNEQSSRDVKYTAAIKEAAEIFNLLKIRKQNRVDHFKVVRPESYTKLKTNRYLVTQSKNLDNDSICTCSPYDEEPCGMNSKCLNRIVMYECDPETCPAGAKCENQSFKLQKYPKLKEMHIDNNRGFGLIALEDLYAGQFVTEYVGEVIDQKEFQSRLSLKLKQKDENFYFLTINSEYTIDAGPKGNIARFMNHSCDPNCETQKWMVDGQTRVGLFAINDIKANTELTFNYQWEIVGKDKQNQACHCGASKCTGFIGSKKKSLAKTGSTDSISKITPVVKERKKPGRKSKKFPPVLVETLITQQDP